MYNFEFVLPTKIIFGAGEVKRVGEQAATFGKKAMLVTYDEKLVKDLGFYDKVANSCREAVWSCSITSASRATPLPSRLLPALPWPRRRSPTC